MLGKRAIVTTTILSLLAVLIVLVPFWVLKPTIDAWKAERRGTVQVDVSIPPTALAPTKVATQDVSATPPPTPKSPVTQQVVDDTAKNENDWVDHLPGEFKGKGMGQTAGFIESPAFPKAGVWFQVWTVSANPTLTSDVFAYVKDGKWVFSAPQPSFLRTGQSMVALSTRVDSNGASYEFYDVLTSELIAVTFDGKDVRIQKKPRDLSDVLAVLPPDNECNFDHALKLIKRLSTPGSTKQGVYGRWNLIDGCNLGWTTVVQENPTRVTLVIQQGKDSMTYSKDSGWLFRAPEKIGDTLQFPYWGGAIVSYDVKMKKFTEMPANQQLLMSLLDIKDDGLVTLYKRMPDADKIVNIRDMTYMSDKGVQYAGWQKIGDAYYVAGIQYQIKGEWNTALFFMKDKTVYGPAVIPNIREHKNWSTDSAGNPTSQFADNTVNTFVMNKDGSVTIK